MVGIEKLELPNKRFFNGNEFPVAYKLTDNSNDNEILEFLEKIAKEGFFKKQLKQHGCVVIRNPGKNDPEVMSKFIKAIGENSGNELFIQNGSTATRREITNILSTANEGPSERPIYQHNEFSRFIKYPTTLFFVCSNYNGEGGETPIVHGGELFNAVNEKAPEFTKELSKKGLYMEQIWPLKSDNKTNWAYKFCFGRNIDPNDNDFEHQKKSALELAKEIASPHSEFIGESNDLLIRQYTNPIRLYETEKGEAFPCFFNSIATFYANVKHKIGEYDKTKSICYNDNTVIETKYLDLVLQKSIELAYNHSWEEGDIAIVDNYQVSHGRCPWNEERTILVSMWDEINKSEYKVWEPEN